MVTSPFPLLWKALWISGYYLLFLAMKFLNKNIFIAWIVQGVAMRELIGGESDESDEEDDDDEEEEDEVILLINCEDLDQSDEREDDDVILLIGYEDSDESDD